MSSANAEWEALASKLIRGQIPRTSLPWVRVELARLHKKALKAEARARRAKETV